MAIGAIGLFAPVFPAAAATPEATPADPQAQTTHNQAELGAVTVTDTVVVEGSYRADRLSSSKATADLVDTPRSVTVLTRQLLDDTHSTTLAEALRMVPGITLGAGEGGNPLGDRPFIRGSDSSNAIHIDGLTDIAAQTRETFDVESVEVVKGSDGITNGSGNAAGSINIVSKAPEEHRFVAVEGDVGSAAYRRFTIDVNQPLTSTIGLRINAMSHDQNVSGRAVTWQRRWGIAPSLTIGMGTPTRVTLDWYHLNTAELPDEGIPYTRAASSLSSGVTEVAPLGTDAFATANGQTVTRSRDTFYGLANRDFRRTLTDAATVRVAHDLGGGFQLTNATRYSHVNQEYLWTLPDDSKGNVYAYGTVSRRVNSRYSRQTGVVDQLAVNGKFDTGPLKHSLAAAFEYNWQKSGYGSYYADSSRTALPLAIACPTATSGTNAICTSASNPNPYDQWTGGWVMGSPQTMTLANWTTLSASVYDTISIGDKWKINLGGRYDHFVTHASAALSATSTAQRTWARRQDDLFTYQAGLVYKPRPNGSVYFSTATSVIAPGSFLAQGSEDNAFVSSTTTIDPSALKVQHTTSYELGTKWNFFGDGLSVTADIFQTRTTNARTTDAGGFVSNVGIKRVRGFEASVSGNVTDKWSLFGGYAHTPSVITDGGYTLVAGAYVPAASTGRRAPNTPMDSMTLTSQYKITPRFTLGGSAIFNSKVYGGFAYGSNASVVRGVYVPSYWRFDANASYRPTNHITIKLDALNLTDKLYYDQAYASHYAHQAAGRTIIGSVAFKY
ncbi:TonB-dependent siderophore receptor [Novosphingobium nitrogenifigens DSM 19370]|uniref:TonB-dependent siderophore receptor n=2 Tax=Novosphingobium nitrogenifigens TaxID=378548 RepID=F1Z9N2_9SPHN|nr:TonB-dependent siderophore receptor [Novosphingobium nitrogenifigens DSM 19370]